MRTNRRRILAAALLLLITGGLIWWFAIFFGLGEPVYDGHRINYWIYESRSVAPVSRQVPVAIPSSALLVTTNSGRIVLSPTSSILTLSPVVFTPPDSPPLDLRAVPYLVKALRRRDGPWQGYYSNLWPKLPAWWRARFPPPIPADEIAARAIRMLALTGPASPRAIQALADLAAGNRVSSLRASAIESLVAIGAQNTDAIKALVRIAREARDAGTRLLAIDSLSQIGAQNEPAIEGLAQVAQHESFSGTRFYAIHRLVETGGNNEIVINTLTKLQNDPDLAVRTTATNLLKKIENLPGGQ